MKRYISNPITIEAAQFTEASARQIEEWSNRQCITSPVLDPTEANPSGVYMQIQTPEGCMTAIVGDYIIKGTIGEYYPCKPEVFAVKYREATPDTPATRHPMSEILRNFPTTIHANKIVADELDRLHAENERLRGEVEGYKNHEHQTHETLGAILGTDDSLEQCAMRMKAKLAEAEKVLAGQPMIVVEDDQPKQTNPAPAPPPAKASALHRMDELKAKIALQRAESDRLMAEYDAALELVSEAKRAYDGAEKQLIALVNEAKAIRDDAVAELDSALSMTTSQDG